MSAAEKGWKSKPIKAEKQKRVCQNSWHILFFNFFKDFSSSIFLHRFFFIGLRGVIGTFLLFGLLTDFRGYLAAGQWLAPEICCYCFVTQISQMAQIFLRESFCPTDFTDFHRFFYRISVNRFCPISGGICNDRTGRIRENPWVIASAGNLRINSVSSDE